MLLLICNLTAYLPGNFCVCVCVCVCVCESIGVCLLLFIDAYTELLILYTL